MLAYISWHRRTHEVQCSVYEDALGRFHRSLAHSPPSGFRGSVVFRTPGSSWLQPEDDPRDRFATRAEFEDLLGLSGDPPASEPAGAYEDWYLLDGWSALGVLEEATASRGHLTAHDALSRLSGPVAGAVYRLCEGLERIGQSRMSVWVAPARGHDHPTIASLLGDGIDHGTGSLWRRCLGLGPAPEYCLLSGAPPAGTAPTRLPAGWRATISPREVLFGG